MSQGNTPNIETQIHFSDSVNTGEKRHLIFKTSFIYCHKDTGQKDQQETKQESFKVKTADILQVLANC